MTLLPESEPIFAESAIKLTIRDDAAGEFLEVATLGEECEAGTILIEPAEWPQLREAIDSMMAEIAKHEIKADTSMGNYIVKIIAE